MQNILGMYFPQTNSKYLSTGGYIPQVFDLYIIDV